MKSQTMNYNTDVPTTMRRALEAGARLGWTVTQADEGMGFLVFNTGRSLRSWAGQNVSITVVPTPSGSSLTFNATLATHGNPLGGGSQLTGWGEAKKMRKAFAREMGN
jgi:hypothetical protein